MKLMRILILLLFLVVGSVLYGMAGIGEVSMVKIWDAESLGVAFGLGIPTMLIFSVIGFSVLFLSKKVWMGILATSLVVVFMATGGRELNSKGSWLMQAVIGESTVVSSLLIWNKLTTKKYEIDH